jgi:hypothetical protein
VARSRIGSRLVCVYVKGPIQPVNWEKATFQEFPKDFSEYALPGFTSRWSEKNPLFQPGYLGNKYLKTFSGGIEPIVNTSTSLI